MLVLRLGRIRSKLFDNSSKFRSVIHPKKKAFRCLVTIHRGEISIEENEKEITFNETRNPSQADFTFIICSSCFILITESQEDIESPKVINLLSNMIDVTTDIYCTINLLTTSLSFL